MKVRHQYRLHLEDESHLSRLFTIKVSWWRLLLAVILLVGVTTVLSIVIIMNTTLKTFLPGYLPPQEREATIGDLVRVDSLQHLYNVNQQYLENLMRLLDSDRAGGDSLKYVEEAIKANEDSLMPATKREREFRAMMDERERYNLSVLAPLAADGMVFDEPASGYTFAHGSESEKNARLIIPKGESVNNLTPGTVISIVYSPATAYTILIQHNNGFVSRWNRLGLPLVEEGERVQAGQAIAHLDQGSGRDSRYVELRLWRNGTPLIPYQILRSDRILTPGAVIK